MEPDLRQGRDRSLKRRVVVDRVFAVGLTAKGFPLLARFAAVSPDGEAPTRVAFTVSKRRFKRAVDRNRIKRLMRESWRHRRSLFEDEVEPGTQWAVVLIFVGREMPRTDEVHAGMDKLLKRMETAVSDQSK